MTRPRWLPSLTDLLLSGGLALLWIFALYDHFGSGFYPTRRAILVAGGAWLVTALVLCWLLPLVWRVISRLPRRNLLLYGLLSLGLGSLMVTFLPAPEGRAQVLAHTLHIQPLDSAGCQPVTLLGFQTEQGFISYHSFGDSPGWTRNDNRLVSQIGAGALDWRGYIRDSRLAFQGGANACPVQVTWDGLAAEYALDGPSTPFYVDQPLPQPKLVRAFASTAALALLSSLMLAVILALVGMTSEVGAAAANRSSTLDRSFSHSQLGLDIPEKTANQTEALKQPASRSHSSSHSQPISNNLVIPMAQANHPEVRSGLLDILPGQSTPSNRPAAGWMPSAYSAAPTQLRAADWWWIVVPALLSLVLFALVTRTFGLLMGTDSSSYVSAARSLAAGQGYIQANGDTFDWWPPLYPFLLSFGYRFSGLDPLVFARWVNLFCSGLTVLGFGVLLRRLVPGLSRPLAAGLTLLVGLSPVLITWSFYLLSEPVFLLAITAWLVFFERCLRRGSTTDLVLCSVCAGLTALSRYVGVVVVAVAARGVLLALARRPLNGWPWAVLRQPSEPRGGKAAGRSGGPNGPPPAAWGYLAQLVRAGSFGLLASLPTFVWLYHNQVLSGSLTGKRSPSGTPLAENGRAALAAVTGFFAPFDGGWFVLAEVLTAVLLLAGFAGLILLARRESRSEAGLTRETFFALLMAGFVLIYSAYLVISLTIVENAPIGLRLMGPVYLPLLLVLIYVGERAVRIFRAGSNPRSALKVQAAHWLAMGAWGLLVLGMAVPVGPTLLGAARIPVVAEPNQLSIYALRGNLVLAELRQNPLLAQRTMPTGQPVYSNCPRCLVIFAEVYNAGRFDEQPDSRIYLPSPGETFTLVWLTDINLPGLGQPEGTYTRPLPDLDALLGRVVKKSTLYEGPDGGIYQVSGQ